MGFEEAVAALEVTQAAWLRTAYVNNPESPWLFVVIADETDGQAVTCIEVNHPEARSDDPFPSAYQRPDGRWSTRRPDTR
jgi:hypothetical protein